MKNIHLIQTDEPSRLLKSAFGLELLPTASNGWRKPNQNIYITSDEEIKEGDWIYIKTPNICDGNIVVKHLGFGKDCWSKNILTNTTDEKGYHPSHCKKIILTTDQDLIADIVQPIDNEFLEWFVKNPSCESVEVKNYKSSEYPLNYKIIIPKEEPKQETLSYTEAAKKEERIFNSTMMKQEIIEEAAENLTTDQIAWRWLDIEENYNSIEDTISFVKGVEIGAKWQSDRMYNEEEVIELLQKYRYDLSSGKTANIGDTTKVWFEQNKKK
jgi:hypothetical protein